jgi:hypothetical protein
MKIKLKYIPGPQDNLRAAKGMFFGIILSLLFWIGIGLLIFFSMC